MVIKLRSPSGSSVSTLTINPFRPRKTIAVT